MGLFLQSSSKHFCFEYAETRSWCATSSPVLTIPIFSVEKAQFIVVSLALFDHMCYPYQSCDRRGSVRFCV